MALWRPREITLEAPLARRDRRVLHVVGAVAALLLVTGLLIRGTVGLSRAPTDRIVTVDPATGQVTSGGVDLGADRTRPMFPGVHLEPGVAMSSCLEVEHDGSVPIDTVALRIDATEGSSLLLDHLQIAIERGEPGADATCAGFVPTAAVADGRIAQLATPSAVIGFPSWQPVGHERASYRFTVLLPEDAAIDELQGARARVDFLWVATAQPTADALGPRLLLLTVAVARDALLPLLLLAVGAVLFLGVQDRIDRRDPKLAMAAVHEEPPTFRQAGDGR